MLDRPVDIVVHVGPDNLQLPASRGGAIERRMMALARVQLAAGLRPVVYSWAETDGVRDIDGVPIRYISTNSRLPVRRLQFAARFVHDLDRAASIVHLHSRPDIAWLLRASGLKTPTVLSCDNHLAPGHRWTLLRPAMKILWRRCLSSASIVAPVSDYCRDLHREYWGLKKEQLAVIPNGVDLSHFRPMPEAGTALRRQLGLEGKRVVLYVGRVCRQKGTDVLLAAFQRLRWAFPDLAVVVVGPPEKFGNTQDSDLLAALRLAGICYLPPVDDAVLPSVYNACDIFVMPTRELEMFGMAAVEAQACGKPIVASDHGGLRETVPLDAGRRFRAGDNAELAGRIADLLSSPGLRCELQAGAIRNAARYAWANVASDCQKVYTEAKALCAHVASYGANGRVASRRA